MVVSNSHRIASIQKQIIIVNIYTEVTRRLYMILSISMYRGYMVIIQDTIDMDYKGCINMV